MGTRLRIVAEGATRSRATHASETALRQVERWDRLLSTWDPSTDLSRLNAAPLDSAVRVSPEVADLLIEVEGWARRTDRAFDPTVGALVDAWGLRGPPRESRRAELGAALAATGAGLLTVVDASVTRRAAGGWIDAGGFGKGAALRSAARALQAVGAPRVLLDLGGQIWAGAPANAPWTVDVARPDRRFEGVVRLRVHGVSVATSGTSERPGHLLDPRTGRRVPAWGSVTVVSADAVEADVLSTALYVMGPDAGLRWARRQAAAALFLSLDGRGIRARWTPAMERWLVEPADAGPAPHAEAAR